MKRRKNLLTDKMKLIVAVFLLCCLYGNISGDDSKSGKWVLMKPEDGGPMRWQHMVPAKKAREVPEENVHVLLFTRPNIMEGLRMGVNDVDILLGSNFDPAKKTYIFIHGWGGSGTSTSSIYPKNATLEVADVNVFSIDWNPHADQDYGQAKVDIPEVAAWAAVFVRHVINEGGANIDDITVMGHSMGSQVAGFLGQEMNGELPIIIGCDPAGPLYEVDPPEERLDATDARFVQIIHTNTNFLGFKVDCGDADIYPNGGELQPGCEWDFIGACDHARSYEYYTETILAGGGFTSTSCGSMQDLIDGVCADNPTTTISNLETDTSASGAYFLEVNDVQPYSLG